ncbi:uncharacterized protein LOC111262518 isoform X2 [Varroa jacobsoni]|uniref:uncharacterized protein LOC111262518 isoform X2 n=1 Tax=Varroa jacobsoni TaxID=62625 RepID=UPI000BF91D2C|nr:uncharacterized protein LOC111262518 isoform X2 [Varroa jacobsoni]XP_022692565.1 uncharacterized protein LOC111262518 isoform X2 [Varroa jacobsoni]XP_022692566.1 uncharacterized protein LOC111262518 isoform X2 [Varroa jacobsoni]XP_022692567.1 uncharacterized protein LOC111262518 isoform X2 [Varroa jacobsoni]XP_022692568.1 uncharacterized protein LOC111262518 isoform X2 [Varroa jacobsoni]
MKVDTTIARWTASRCGCLVRLLPPLLLGCIASSLQGAAGVTVTEVRLQTDSATQDQFVLEGEPASLVCFFQLKPNEEIQRVTWLKDGTDEVYVWRRKFQPLARLLFQDRTDLSNRSPSFVKIDSAHRSMQGNYTCRVETDKGVSENDFYLIVIVDSCKEQSWTTYSDRIGCTEEIRLDCTGMHPKPSPACGVYNEATQSYLSTVPFDTVHLVNGTYDVKLHKIFRIKDWIEYRNISFRCHVIVLGTEWRTGMTHRLFGDPGCLKDPPEVRNGSFNLTGEQTCWGTPAEGAVVQYSCPVGLSVRGHQKMVCKNGTWVGVVGNRNLDELNYSPLEIISCEEDSASSVNVSMGLLLFLMVCSLHIQ